MRCLTSARFTMYADLLKPGDATPDPINLEDYGQWVRSQDPLTGQIVRVWEPYPDNPDTPTNEHVTYGRIRCIARGVVDGGIRVAGTTENFGQSYENIDFVKMWVPPRSRITKRDRVTNIRTQQGHIMWADEEAFSTDPNAEPRATVFNVNGVTPLFNAWNQPVEDFIMLARAQVVSEETV